MNFIISLQKRFGSAKTKTKALEFENLKLLEEINYKINKLSETTDHYPREYIKDQIEQLQLRLESNIGLIEDLK